MKQYRTNKQEQLELLESKAEPKQPPAKRVNIVSLKLVKESSILYKNRSVKSPEDAYSLLNQFLGNVDREYFVAVTLNTKYVPININLCHIGSLNAPIVHPREVMKFAVLSNTAAIMVGHPHQSGDPTPSQEDIEVTQRLVEGGKIIGIDVLNYIILIDNRFILPKGKGRM